MADPTVIRNGVALVLLATAALGACDKKAQQGERDCGYALEDGRKALAESDIPKARTQHDRASKLCAKEREADVTRLRTDIEAREARLAEMRKDEDEAEKKARDTEKKGPVPVAGKHSSEAKATGFCKEYVDCVCGIADWVFHVSGEDKQRALCTDAKKVLAGAKAQEGCQQLLGEFTSNAEWRQPYEAMGITIPDQCP